MSLPIFQTQSKDISLLQTTWSTSLNPVVNNPINQANVLKNVLITTGTNVINHLLGRKLQGWFIVGQNALASIYDQQETNQSPQLTLVLVSSANVTLQLAVF